MREELDELKRTIYVLKLESGFNAISSFCGIIHGCNHCHQKIKAITL